MTGRRPVGWLSRYLHTENLRATLASEGYLYHMDDYSDDVPRWDVVATTSGPRAIVVLPYAIDSNDMKMWVAPSYTPRDWLDYAVASFDWLWEEGASAPRMMSLGLHLRIIGRPGRIWAFERFLQHATSRRGVWLAQRAEIARAFAAAVPPPAEVAPC
jgi:peptidoglycan/xylan/chitin deacetylase (PgdA/CDA1 family)